MFYLDLEQLELIKVGDNALNGNKQEECSLIMKGTFNALNYLPIDLPALKTLFSNNPGFTFYGSKLVILSSLICLRTMIHRYSKRCQCPVT